MSISILGLGTASPSHGLDQPKALELAGVYARNECRPRILEALYRQSGIAKRGSVLAVSEAEFGLPFFQAPEHEADLGPGTAERMARFQLEAVELATAASLKALDQAGVKPFEITHLVLATCTGFFAPGLDILLLKRLNLNPSIGRFQIGFMGCHGAFNALQTGRAFARESSGSRVLVCATELCSLHMQYGGGMDGLVANALFADGSASVVLGDSAESTSSLGELQAFGSQLIPDSLDAMSWKIGDHGFEMTLSSKVPALIETHLKNWLESWLKKQNLSLSQIASWVVHPGGPRILDAVQRSLELPDSALQASRAILSAHGNMSSPTVLFILDSLRTANGRIPGPSVMLGFGPGLVAEAALLG